uniref:Dual specificity protein phosphatase n=1 Tax=Oncorhynchus kisutch TaxID=8019 RepID=A0A8C7KVA2_ONCKI
MASEGVSSTVSSKTGELLGCVSGVSGSCDTGQSCECEPDVCEPPSLEELEEVLHSAQSSCRHGDEVWPNLYLGDMYMSHNKYELWKLGITHVLNAAHVHPPGIKVRRQGVSALCCRSESVGCVGPSLPHDPSSSSSAGSHPAGAAKTMGVPQQRLPNAAY